MRILSGDLEGHLGKTVTVSGWVNSRRDHGGLIFIDLRDHTGVIQLVVTPETEDAFKLAETLRDEFVITATGILRERAPELINPNIPTGKIELVVETLTLLNRSDPPPVNTHDDGEKSSEEQRLRYRFLDLRRPSMQKLLRRRSEFYRFIRDYMYARDFVEINTPILANSSPEGARDFLVPSRLHPGEFYALPQAPQQFKQLLMVGGVPKYFQIAPCFRDEDPRADRLYGDFYQLDLEESFVDDGEIIRQEIEPLFIELAEKFAGKKIVLKSEAAEAFVPDYSPIPRLPFEFALATYGTDKPDLRFGLELINLTSDFKDTSFKVFQTDVVKAIRVPGGASLTRREIDNFTEEARKLGAGGLAYILFEPAGNDDQYPIVESASGLLLAHSPIAKFLTPAELAAVVKKTGATVGDAVFFAADVKPKVNKILGALRLSFADHFGMRNPEEIAYTWVVDFPFYEWDETRHCLDFGHNPFSMPRGGLAVLENAETDAEKLAIRADQFDMVMNGSEAASGAVRNYNPEIMYKAFEAIGYDRDYVASRFGAMLGAFKFGAPPHAGCAPGLDRIFMILEGVDNIRDVVAFPKNGAGVDLMMTSPSCVDDSQLEELSIEVSREED